MTDVEVTLQDTSAIVVTVGAGAQARAVGEPVGYRVEAVTVEPLSISALAVGPKGDPGYRGYTHEQQSASDTWTVPHGLGRRPGVNVVDSAGDLVVGFDVAYPDLNTAVVSFAAALAGSAYLI